LNSTLSQAALSPTNLDSKVKVPPSSQRLLNPKGCY
jgi:hypothetical protein